MSRALLTEARDVLQEIMEGDKYVFEAIDLEDTRPSEIGKRILYLIDAIDAELDRTLIDRIIGR